jgi:single-stranded-DNA-specific exonuclease
LSRTSLDPSRWLLPEIDNPSIAALSRDLKLHLPAARVLFARGYRDCSSAAAFLDPQLADLHDPYVLKDMDRAVARLCSAIASREKILLYGDYDVDGTTSIVILKKALELTGVPVDFFVPHRTRDGYGMRTEVIDRAALEGVKLIISVDTGIRAGAVVAHARDKGIDVVVTDHHLPEAELPPALAVINPNRSDCRYPEKNLCGAGVTFKLVQALMTALDWPAGRISRLSESFLKMVAVATVADVVPLCGENRVIVKRGLEGFHTVRNPGLRALLQVAGFQDGECPSAGQIAFRIAPRINAAGRMANASDVVEMFLTADAARAQSLATELHELNKERQETEADIVRRIEEECTRVPVANSDAALVFSGDGWHRGVVGIVASRIVERYHRPVFVISEDASTGTAHGSGRSIPRFHLLDALESMPDLFAKFGGHRQAAGITLPCASVAHFRERLNVYASSLLTVEDFKPTIEIDARLDLSELNDDSVAQVLSLAPFGCGNPAPSFAVLGAEIAGPPSIGERLVRVPVRQNGRTLFLKSWNSTDRWQKLSPGDRVDIALCLEEDAYSARRGYPGWCAVLKDFRPAAASTAAP